MQYVAAYTLASLSGKEPTKDAVVKILKATGKSVDDAQVAALFDSVKGRPVHELIAKGQSKVGAVGAPTSASSSKAADNKPSKAAEKAAEKKPEPVQQEVEDEDFNLDLFG